MRVKMIWDFRGPAAGNTAKHHAVHLGEFARAEDLKDTLSGSEAISEQHYIAYLVVDEKLVPELRERLKPNRGRKYEN